LTETAKEIPDRIKFCIDVILKEAREESRLVKQIFYVMLSMYTNNPINLAINAPTGEGKNYIIKKVGELFPRDDVIYLAGLSEKALYHRRGNLVVKDPFTGKYESVENRLKGIDSQIEDKESEALATSNRDLKRSLRHDIKDLEQEKKDLMKDARNLIDLSHKTLVLLDTPSRGLFGALMALLSHDHWEVEYEFADTSNTGIATKVNVLRGWPSVIFAQAIDYSSYSRWPEVARRFPITNPNMDRKKYDKAIDLMAKKFGTPDFIYQGRVVSREEKDAARDIILEIKEGLLDLTGCTIESGKNNVIIPYITPLNKSLSRQKASDMTTSYRLFSFLSLIPQINLYSRPYLQVIDPTRKVLFILKIPFATFEDLKEAIYLMEYADGVRPYILMWYHQVFLPTFNAKDKRDSRLNSKGIELVEKRIAVTSEQLSKATENIQNKIISPKQIRESYLEALINQGYVDKIDSELDKRSDIYYPLTSKISKLGDWTNSPNSLQQSKIDVLDPAIFPNKDYIKTSVEAIINYTISKGFQLKIICPDREITVVELVDRYYANGVDFFSLKPYPQIVYSECNEKRADPEEKTVANIQSITTERKITEKLDDEVNSPNYINFQKSKLDITHTSDNGTTSIDFTKFKSCPCCGILYPIPEFLLCPNCSKQQCRECHKTWPSRTGILVCPYCGCEKIDVIDTREYITNKIEKLRPEHEESYPNLSKTSCDYKR
jgi:hypothetical protein